MKLFLNKFKYAFRGIFHAFRDPGVRYQLAGLVIALIFFYFLHLTAIEWIVVVLCCGFVIVCEVINYIVECIMNYIQPAYSKKVEIIKDVSAGMVLLSCITATIVAFIILYGKL